MEVRMSKAVLTVWDDDDCRSVHEATKEVLATTGVDVRDHEQSLALFAAAGAKVEGNRVRVPGELVEEALAAAPREWPVPGRREGGPLTLTDGQTYFGSGSDCLYLRDPDSHERRRIGVGDVEELAAVSNRLENLDFVMSMGLPGDVPQVVDDLWAVAAMLGGTTKPLMVAPKDGIAVRACRDMAEACGDAASVMIYAMPSPPLQHDAHALGKVIACAETSTPLVYAAAPSCGTTAPRSLAAATVVANAEVLSGLVLHQYVRPGAPFVYGPQVGAPDMRTGFEPHGAPEVWLSTQVAADLARFYGLPSFNYAGMTDANTLDEQWAAEEFATALLGALQRSTLVHDVGYLEVGLQSSFESLVFGDECLAWARAFAAGVEVSEATLALEEIAAVGPGGHFLARRYTRQHNADFWLAGLFDRVMHDRWQKGGGKTLLERVRERVVDLRSAARPFTLSDETREELAGIIATAGECRQAVEES
jgi:trimethylamine---corrinoid protein Co-methyltransferase